MRVRTVATALVASTAVLATGASAASAAGTVALRTVPGLDALVVGSIAPAPHGDLWFTGMQRGPQGASGPCVAGRLDPVTGTRRPVTLPAGVTCAIAVAPGRAGAVWLTGTTPALAAPDRVVRVAADGTSRTWPITADGAPLVLAGLTSATDGAAWVVDRGGERAVRISPGGTTRVTTLPSVRAGVGGMMSLLPLVAGRGGAVWVARSSDVVSVDARGRARRFALPVRFPGSPTSIAVGKDGRPWVIVGTAVLHLGAHGFEVTDPGRSRPQALTSDAAGGIRVAASAGRRFGALTARGIVRTGAVPADRGLDVSLIDGFTVAGSRLYAIASALVEVVERPVCWVPDVVGDDTGAARSALKRSGCAAVVVQGPVRAGASPVVSAQTVPAGSILSRGATVTVTFGSPTSCIAPTGASKVLDGPAAVVFDRTDDADPDAVATTRWWTCLVGDPAVRPFATYTGSGIGYGEGLYALAGAGTRLAYVHWKGYARSEETTSTLELVDLAAGGTPVVVARFGSGSVARTVVSPGGNVAWIAYYPSARSVDVHVWHDGVDRAVGTVDGLGAALIDLRVDETTVSWTDGRAAERPRRGALTRAGTVSR